MDANVFTVFSSMSVLKLPSGFVCSCERHASSQGLAKSAASHSAKSATNVGQKTFSFQCSFQLVLQDGSKRKCCCFVHSCMVPSHTKSGTHGSSPLLEEDTHPTSKPQQVCSVPVSETPAGKHINVLIRFSSPRPSSIDGTCCLTCSPSSHSFRGRGGRWNIQQQQLAKLNYNRVVYLSSSFRLNRLLNSFRACRVQSLLSSSPLCFACSLFRCNTNHANMQQ